MNALFNKIKQNKFATVITVILVVVVGFIIWSNKTSRYAGNPAYDSSGGDYAPSSKTMSPMVSERGFSSDSAGTASPQEIQQSDKKIIKNGSLSILAEKADEASKQIQQIAESNGGSVDSVDIYDVTDDTKAGTITIRVPNDKFDAAIAEIKKIAVKVEREVVTSSDVTAQYVDLEARLTNLRAVEKQYQSILASAHTVEDTLAVYAKLAEVRGSIESVQGQINYLSRQIDMSTITVSVTAESDVQVFGIVWRPLTVIKQAFRNFLTDMTNIVNFAIVFVFWLPGFIIKLSFLAIVLIILWKFFKIVRRRFNSKNLPGMTP